MKNNILPAIRLTLICLLFFPGIYTLIIYAVAQLAPNHGEGEVVNFKGRKNYVNIAQNFSGDRYFSSRPSAVNYNAAGSGGSNKGPFNPDYLNEVDHRIKDFMAQNPDVGRTEIPSDLVTAGGSGLDPHISVQAAKVQVKRIAKQRSLSVETLNRLIDSQTEKPWLGLFGTTRINILKLNIELDKITQ